ncbi:MAG: chemotaxis response regulator protein-glutamate methylesterase [Bacteroidota bacterium]|nr:chemotaxis response regulator protein-glutamate methylesterase [Candidatus Kapabacteria bacterium]MDW8219862.1 chemotaxis response regulator protein-glutamate methylesterase [Bacteroidota bacterium]
MHKRTIRVLIVDDSALARDILSRGLSADPHIEVVGTATDPFAAREKILQFRPDVLTLDVEMPRMDGIEFLRRLMPQYPLPVVMVSSLTQRGKERTLQALEAGAVDFVAKPSANIAQGLEAMMVELRTKVKIAATANIAHWKYHREALFASIQHSSPEIPGIVHKYNTSSAVPESSNKVIALGASTGGTEALRRILKDLPATLPGIVVVQHMPAGFTTVFAHRLNGETCLQVKEAEHGDRVSCGKVLIAPGNKHMRVVRSGGQYEVVLSEDDKVNGHRPSVDVLMCSVAKNAGRNAIGGVLTGMGKDGAVGLKAMRDAGAETFVQDEASSVVYGMPKEAVELGAASIILPLDKIAAAIVSMAQRVC